jgi:hypothetical protein
MMRLSVWFLSAAMLVAVVPAVSAQEQSPGQSPAPSPSEPSQNIPDQKLDAAAAALNQIANVKENYQQRIDSANPDEKQRLATEANGALVKAVTDQGLSLEEYTAIIVVAQNDPVVREKIIQRLRAPSQ